MLLTGKAAAHIAGAGHPNSEKPVILSDEPGEGMYFAAVLHVQAQGGKIETQETGKRTFNLKLNQLCSHSPAAKHVLQHFIAELEGIDGIQSSKDSKHDAYSPRRSHAVEQQC